MKTCYTSFIGGDIMLLEMEPRLFDLDFQLMADSSLMIIAVLCLIAFFIGIAFIIKLLIKELRKK